MQNRNRGENPVKIIRWNAVVTLPSGERSNMLCRIGSVEEVRAFAEEIAKENGAVVAAIV